MSFRKITALFFQVIVMALLLTACVTEPVIKKNPVAPAPVEVKDGWVRWVPASSPNTAAYFAIENPSLLDDALVGASSPRARAVEVHRIVEVAGLKRMQRLTSVVVEPANRFEFAPGGFHLMLIGLDAPLQEGETIPLTLEFSRSGKVEVLFPVMTLVGGQ
jgi:copper(I)-binding protein